MNNFAILEQVEIWLNRQLISPCLIVIAGPTCAGKTYFSQQLQNTLLIKSVVLSLDNYFKDIFDPALPRSPEQHFIFDEPGSFHAEEFRRDVLSLLSGENIRTPVYDISGNHRTGSTITIESAPVIITEGLFAIKLLQDIPVPSLYIYVEADQETCMARRIKRDLKIPHLMEEDIRHHMEEYIIPRQVRYIEPQKRLADLVVNTT